MMQTILSKKLGFNMFRFLILCLMLTGLAHAETAGENCFRQLYAFPEVQSISWKLGIPDVLEVSFEQMANQEKVSESEKEVIAKIAEGYKICEKLDLESQSPNLHEVARAALIDRESDRNNALIELYNQKITYGEYIRIRQEGVRKFEKAIQFVKDENQRITESNEARQSQANTLMMLNAARGARDAFQQQVRPSVTCNPNFAGGVTCR